VTPRFQASLPLILLLAACTAVPPGPRTSAPPPPPRESDAGQVPPQAPPPPPVESFRAPELLRVPGLEWLIEADAARLTGMFGPPRLDTAEGDMRKLQYSGGACVLDVFLYPLRPGGAPVATYVEARRKSDGAEVDRRACAEALRRR